MTGRVLGAGSWTALRPAEGPWDAQQAARVPEGDLTALYACHGLDRAAVERQDSTERAAAMADPVRRAEVERLRDRLRQEVARYAEHLHRTAGERAGTVPWADQATANLPD